MLLPPSLNTPPELADCGDYFNQAWQRFTEVADEALATNAAGRNDLPLVWACSEFVANWCLRQPAAFRQLLDSGDLDRFYPPAWYRDQLDLAAGNSDSESYLDQNLRRFRQRQMVRLAWRELSGQAELEETMAGVSAIADASIGLALKKHSHWLRQRFGQPRDGAGGAVELVVVGLGKLGGEELNYSSDVDLIFAYDGEGETDGEKVINNQAFFIKLGRKIIHSLSRIDADGFVFRTDMRLRPNGDSGPLVLSFAAMEHYYQTHGRSWERYAWIKARAVAGDRHSGNNMLVMLRPFVYRKYLDFSAFESLREMKALIERQLLSKGMTEDIKLGRGGIREIEFLAQSHQLIRGGRETQLQTSSLYQALEVMTGLGVMEEGEKKQLIAAYRFLRNIEHRLQMEADRQTHKLPQQPLSRQRLALSMGVSGWQELVAALESHRREVHRQFSRLLEDSSQDNANDDLGKLKSLWMGESEHEVAAAVLRQLGLDQDGIVPLLQEFKKGSLYQAYSNIEKDRLDRLLPLAIQQAATYQNGSGDNPALSGGDLAQRAISAFISVVESIGRRSVYLSLLIENPLALKQLLHLCAASPWISRHIGHHPVILDELLQPIETQSQDAIRCAEPDIRAALRQRLQQVEACDDEGRLNALREFHHGQVLRIAATDVGGDLQADQVQQALTRLAKVILQQVLQDALEKVTQKLGPPPGEVAIIAYGKLAGGELGYHSDLDIVVCFSPHPAASSTEAEYYFSRVGQRFIHSLTTRTHAGVLFELDMRLRPSGRSGILVVSLAAFHDYQRSHAWTWEHQALVRARILLGSNAMVAAFEEIRSQILGLAREGNAIAGEVRQMRQRMVENNCQSTEQVFDIKLDYGGIVDIEFLLQYLVLVHGQQHRKILEPRDTITLVSALKQARLLNAKEAETITTCYQAYLRTSLDYKLMDRPVLIPINEMRQCRRQIKRLWQDRIVDNGCNSN